MAVDDRRTYVTFYAIEYNDWDETFGSFVNESSLLVDKYISDACDTEQDVAANGTHKFLYPFHIKKVYYIEGRIQGNICVAASDMTSHITDYRVTLCKVNGDSNQEIELASTGTRSVDDDLAWDVVHSIGTEKVYHFYIDCYTKKIVTDEERLYLKIQINSDTHVKLFHSNDPEWVDLWIEVPFKLS
ncbi:hypothetical protein KAX02_01510 [candidate division WOR-3 bacterium]|nr:hypothetical protein [candidate division WOR-3 bacterium]